MLAVAVTNNAVVGVALNYLQANPDETDDVRPLIVLALHGPPVCSATTTPAHVTCGVVAVTADWQVLEVPSSPSALSLLPGGHVDAADRSLLGASLRLLAEQAGVPSEVVTPRAVLPLDVVAVPVPAKGGEPEHVHFDVRFLLQVPREHVRPPAGAGSDNYRWVPVAEIPGRLGTKLRRLAGDRVFH